MLFLHITQYYYVGTCHTNGERMKCLILLNKGRLATRAFIHFKWDQICQNYNLCNQFWFENFLFRNFQD